MRLLRLLVGIALLAAWQSALLHPIEHLDSDGAFVHLADGRGQDGSSDQHRSNLLCDAVAALTACVGGIAKSLVVAFPGDEALLFGRTEAPRSAPAPAYRSQAPPSLL